MLSHCAPTTAAPASVTAAATTTAASAASTTAREGYLDLQRQVAADGVEQRLGRSLPAHQHQLQVHVPFDQQAFGQQADTGDAAQRRLAVRPEGGEVGVGEGGGLSERLEGTNTNPGAGFLFFQSQSSISFVFFFLLQTHILFPLITNCGRRLSKKEETESLN